MGADNWAVCPKCRADGHVTIEQFDQARLEAEAFASEDIEANLREDYELGITTTEEQPSFYVIYKGRCSKCGFSLEYRHEEQVTWT